MIASIPHYKVQKAAKRAYKKGKFSSTTERIMPWYSLFKKKEKEKLPKKLREKLPFNPDEVQDELYKPGEKPETIGERVFKK